MSSEAGLTQAVRSFIREHIHSVADLDLLALLTSAPEKLWTVQALDRALRSNEQSLLQRLGAFSQAGLAEEVEADFRYQPRDPALAAAAEEAIREYRTRPVLVIETIFRPDGDAAQSFADAFRLRPPR